VVTVSRLHNKVKKEGCKEEPHAALLLAAALAFSTSDFALLAGRGLSLSNHCGNRHRIDHLIIVVNMLRVDGSSVGHGCD